MMLPGFRIFKKNMFTTYINTFSEHSKYQCIPAHQAALQTLSVAVVDFSSVLVPSYLRQNPSSLSAAGGTEVSSPHHHRHKLCGISCKYILIGSTILIWGE